MSNVREVVAQIRQNFTQTAASAKDENTVMRAMLNDRDYSVGIYSKEGQIGTYCPAEDARAMIGSIIKATTRVSAEEATALADSHEFTRTESQSMINIGKEFVNVYLDTKRKLPFGGRETSDIAISIDEKEQKTITYPKVTGVADDGKAIYGKGETISPAHKSATLHAKAPKWVK